MNFKIVYLPKAKWKGFNLPIEYISNTYYDVEILSHLEELTINIKKKSF